jgi:hypothetical protein
VKRRFAGSRGGTVAVVTDDRILESNSSYVVVWEAEIHRREELLTSGSLARTLELAGGVVERWRHYTGNSGAVVGSLNLRASRTLDTSPHSHKSTSRSPLVTNHQMESCNTYTSCSVNLKSLMSATRCQASSVRSSLYALIALSRHWIKSNRTQQPPIAKTSCLSKQHLCNTTDPT